MKYKVLGVINLVVPSLDEGFVDSEGFTSKVALYPTMFSSGLRLPFCCPICGLLDFKGMAPVELHPNA